MTKIFLVMLGGSIGALSRYWVSLLALKLFGTRFPWGTLLVNLAGCFLIGVAYALAERGSTWMNPSMRVFFVTGDAHLVALNRNNSLAVVDTAARTQSFSRTSEALHVSQPAHMVPQLPQFERSVAVFTHAPPQLVSPEPHTHAPALQASPVPQE